MYILKVEPMGKPRMVRSDKWAQRDVVLRYRAYCDEVRLRANMQQYRLNNTIDILFYLPMPKSWSKKKQLEKVGQPHDEKPDIDNLVKGFIDAFKEEDKTIHDVHARKYWGTEGRIEIM